MISADGQNRDCRSLAEALEISRKYGADKNKAITLGAGKYFLEETLLLDERDEGLVIEGKAGERPSCLAAGRSRAGKKARAISGWPDVPGVKGRAVELPVTAGKWTLCQACSLPGKGTPEE